MNIINKITNKTRDISVFEFFEVLQQEYIVCELRSKIYPISVVNKAGETIRPRDYWKQTMEKKKEKILDISKRNTLPNIFDDKRIKQDYERKIIPEIGYPKFIYRDSAQQLMQEKWDLHNYYMRNTQVKVMMEDTGKLLIGDIVEVDLNQQKAKIRIKDTQEEQIFNLEIITRIL